MTYNDEMCCNDLFFTVLKNYINVLSLEGMLKTLGIEDEMPPFIKYLDYSKLKPSSIRLFNKIIQRMMETEAETIVEFLGKNNIDFIQIVTKNK